MSRVTTEMTKRYLKGGATRCPFCGSDQIEGDGFDVENLHAWQEMTCLCCDADWRDVYRLYRLEVDAEPLPERMEDDE